MPNRKIIKQDIQQPFKKIYLLDRNISSGTVNISEFNETTLVIGVEYSIKFQASFLVGNSSAVIECKDGNGKFLFKIQGSCPSEAGSDREVSAANKTFVAESSEIIVEFQPYSTATLEGDNTFKETWMEIEELPYQHKIVSNFTTGAV